LISFDSFYFFNFYFSLPSYQKRIFNNKIKIKIFLILKTLFKFEVEIDKIVSFFKHILYVYNSINRKYNYNIFPKKMNNNLNRNICIKKCVLNKLCIYEFRNQNMYNYNFILMESIFNFIYKENNHSFLNKKRTFFQIIDILNKNFLLINSLNMNNYLFLNKIFYNLFPKKYFNPKKIKNLKEHYEKINNNLMKKLEIIHYNKKLRERINLNINKNTYLYTVNKNKMKCIVKFKTLIYYLGYKENIEKFDKIKITLIELYGNNNLVKIFVQNKIIFILNNKKITLFDLIVRNNASLLNEIIIINMNDYCQIKI